MTRIEKFGWKGEVTPGIGRVVSAHGDYYHLVCNEAEGEILARKKKSAYLKMKSAAPDDMKGAKISEIRASEPIRPMTGDFVRFRYNAQGDSMILETLPRFSHFERKDPTARRTSQTLAVNFDVLFIMMSLNENFSVPRINRYLDLARDAGDCEVVVLLTKSDLLKAEDKVDSLDIPVRKMVISAKTGEGMDEVRKIVAPGKTVAFIGSSGVGKSTLLNALAGEEWAATQEIQEWSGKGRHTTTSRELVMLPNGAMVVDTPGIREIGRLDEEEKTLVKGEASHRYRKQ